MANPLGAILAGLGGGASALGESMDQKALLAAQMKRQSAMDAIARMQKLQEMGLSQVPDDTTPTSDANLNPIQQLAAHAQSPQDVIAAGQQMKPTDYAVSQLVKLPNASGNMDTFTQGVPLAEQRDEARQDAMAKRIAAQKAADDAAKSVDPTILADALDVTSPTHLKSQAQALSKNTSLQTTFDSLNKPSGPPMGSPAWIAAKDAEARIGAKYRAPEPAQLVDVPDPQHPGQTVKAWADPRTHQITVTDQSALNKGGGGGAMSGMTMQVLNRLGMSAKDIRASIQQMNDYENDPNGLAAVTPGMATAAQVATSQSPSENKGALSTLNNAAGSWMSSNAQKAMADDPALQRYRTYLFNKQRVGLAFGETLPRVNQEIIKMESQMSGGDLSQNPTLLKAIQDRREYGASQLESMLGNMPGNTSGGNQSGTATPVAAKGTSVQQLWDAAVAKYGQARVMKEYGPRP